MGSTGGPHASKPAPSREGGRGQAVSLDIAYRRRALGVHHEDLARRNASTARGLGRGARGGPRDVDSSPRGSQPAVRSKIILLAASVAVESGGFPDPPAPPRGWQALRNAADGIARSGNSAGRVVGDPRRAWSPALGPWPREVGRRAPRWGRKRTAFSGERALLRRWFCAHPASQKRTKTTTNRKKAQILFGSFRVRGCVNTPKTNNSDVDKRGVREQPFVVEGRFLAHLGHRSAPRKSQAERAGAHLADRIRPGTRVSRLGGARPFLKLATFDAQRGARKHRCAESPRVGTGLRRVPWAGLACTSGKIHGRGVLVVAVLGAVVDVVVNSSVQVWVAEGEGGG